MKCLLTTWFLLAVASWARACLWDRDTLAVEARGFPGLVEILTGRFERPPLLYYEIRLARLIKQLADNPATLEDYDDAAVACDRLGQSDAGIEWLRRKKEHLDKLDPLKAGEHWYRYEANLGTLLAHRWFRAGARRDTMQDLQEGRAHIANAIGINPGAHFGREKYQLMAMDWLLDTSPDTRHSKLPNLLDRAEPSHSHAQDPLWLPPSAPVDAAQGLAGLILLGSGWENFDITYALGLALRDRGDASLATLARLRCEELLAAGRWPMHPRSPEPAVVRGELELLGLHLQHPEPVERFYKMARAAAETWTKQRTEFMQARLQAGMHPDTHPGFWNGWVEPAAPPFPLPSPRWYLSGTVAIVVAAVVMVLLIRRCLRRVSCRARANPLIVDR